MRSRSPSKRRRHGSRGRSPPSSRHGCAKDKEGAAVSLFVSNLPRSCRPEDVQVPFQKFGPVRDVYLPKDYNTGEPRGFAFVEFAHSSDASKARYHMNRKMLSGREISVAFAVQTRKRPEEMRRIIGARHNSPQRKEECRTNSPGQPKGHDEKRKRRSYTPKYKDRQYADIGRDETPPAPDSERPWALCRSPRPSPPGQSHSRSYSRSHSLHLHDHARTRSCSPATGRQDNQSTSPQRREKHQTKSSGQAKEHDEKRRSYTPEYNDRRDADNGYDQTPPAPDGERSWALGRSPQPSPPGRSHFHSHSRSRSPELRGRARSRSCSPAPGRQGDDQYASPQRKEEQQTKSSRQTKEHDEERRSCTPEYSDRRDAFIGHDETPPSAEWGSKLGTVQVISNTAASSN
ncbi:serine/arginine-rich SC35-like splicing factor SCL30A isoform X4 [Oryza glaberrima]|uniref:serine/arginine-rich SC35-like splicing factor SCL30A isoform X4 n=1 Tax=Oryza glaberrima TaxID=4538 RepID=UPI00224BF6B8|nr:serine/arginine-rich SC35-like splicing factor SCL30A isoform X4 [Oryza glaberrima]